VANAQRGHSATGVSFINTRQALANQVQLTTWRSEVNYTAGSNPAYLVPGKKDKKSWGRGICHGNLRQVTPKNPVGGTCAVVTLMKG